MRLEIMDLYVFWICKGLCVAYALLLNVTGSFSQMNVCGHPPLNTKIVGGDDAAPGSWPWQVSFQFRSNHFCGGSLINHNWVLSAAHCFQSYPADEITVYLGIESLEEHNLNEQHSSVSNIIIHQDYDHTTNDNDIALIQLASSVSFTEHVLPVCLAASKSSFPGGTNVWVTGWGYTAENVNLPSPKTLQEVQVPIVSNSNCTVAYGSGTITDNMLCAGLTQGGKDSCQGDSGGPMVVAVSGTWIQAGIVSFGYRCAYPNFPGVYTRVSKYQDWIINNIGSNQIGFIYSKGNCGSPNLFCMFLTFSIISFILSLCNF